MFVPAAPAASLFLVAVALSGCAPPLLPYDGKPILTDVTDSAIGQVRHFRAQQDAEGIGGGAALADVDGDGDLDLFLANTDDAQNPAGHTASMLLANDGTGHFTDVTAASGLDLHGLLCHGAAFADLDNDGDPDLVVVGVGTTRLYRNDRGSDGVARFLDVTDAAGIAASPAARVVSVAIADYDGDGKLDLYTSAYLPLGGSYTGDRTAWRNLLWRNQGGLVFADATASDGGGESGATFVSTFFDADGDGWPELYVANDTGRNPLFNPGSTAVNPADAFFVNRGSPQNPGSHEASGFAATATPRLVDRSALLDTPRSSMGGAVGDLDGDGNLDLFVSDFGGNHLFSPALDAAPYPAPLTDRAPAAGINGSADSLGLLISFGAELMDLDADGLEDLVVVNGAIEYFVENGPAAMLSVQRDVVYLNRGDLVFTDISSTAGLDRAELTHQGRGLARGDLDGDGDDDLVVAPYEDTFRVYRNDGPRAGRHYLRVQLVGNGTSSNRDAVGARVTLSAGGHAQVREVITSGDVGCARSTALYFGLGENDRVDGLTVRWPDGAAETVEVGAVDRTQTITEAAAR